MYATFSSDLEAATLAEATSQRSFEALLATKAAELRELAALKLRKAALKAEAEASLADTTQTYDDTEAQMKADTEFFDATDASCRAKHSEWEERQALRGEEAKGIAEALEVLTSDDARELFARSIKPGKETLLDVSPSLLQVHRDLSARDLERRAQSKAYAALRAAAHSTHSLRLASLAARLGQAGVGHFDKVLDAIDALVAALKEEDAADISKRDQCKEEYKKINSTISDLSWKIENNEGRIEKLTNDIGKRTKEKMATSKSILEVQEQIKEMKSNRQEEHLAFQQAKKDDEDAVGLLKLALGKLSKYYDKNKVKMGPVQGSVQGVTLAQEARAEPVFNVSADQAPDAEFSGKGKRKNEAKGVVSLMTYLIEDLQDEIKNGIKSEAKAQAEFEAQLKAAETLEASLTSKKESLHAMIARIGEAKADEQARKEANADDLSEEETYLAKIKPDCDWMLGAFEKRASHRAAEMQGLVSAKDFLAGAKASLVQGSSAKASDGSLARIRFLGIAK